MICFTAQMHELMSIFLWKMFNWTSLTLGNYKLKVALLTILKAQVRFC